jgi:hypothetical protein
MLVIGEVQTSLLPYPGALPPAMVAAALDLVSGQPVSSWERPIRLSRSPARLTGVDCWLTTASGRQARGVGTVLGRAVVIGGRILQGSTAAVLAETGVTHRRTWAEYLTSPGTIELIKRAPADDLAEGFLRGRQDQTNVAELRPQSEPGSTLDLGAITERIVNEVVRRERTRHGPPFRSRTSLRWVARGAEPGAAPSIELDLRRRDRYVQIRVAADKLSEVAGLSEELARFDWLLTTVDWLIDRSGVGAARPTDPESLRLAVTHLLHLWVPSDGLVAELRPVRDQFDISLRLSRQWDALADRIRDALRLDVFDRVTVPDMTAPRRERG